MGFAARRRSPTPIRRAPGRHLRATVPSSSSRCSRHRRQSGTGRAQCPARFLHRLIASGAVDRVATGHTRTDQAETVLYRILRGSGLTGLSGILPVTREGLVRPLLEIDRSEIEAWLRERGIAWREDDTNRDRTYRPQSPTPRNPAAAARRASTLNWTKRSPTWPHSPATKKPTGTPNSPIPNPQPPTPHVCPSHNLDRPSGAGPPTDPPSMRWRRAIRGRSIDFAHVERVLEMARSSDGHDRFQAPGLDDLPILRLDPSGARREPPPDDHRDFSFALDVPGSVELPGSRHPYYIAGARERSGHASPVLQW